MLLLITIAVLVGIALWLLKSLLAPPPEPPTEAQGSGVIPPWHSDYKQLRVEYHQSVDRSLSPPKS